MPEQNPDHEKLASFDELASIDLMRFDIRTYGHVLPETLERVADEEMSSIAEGIGRAACTSFTYEKIDGQLVYFSQGQKSSYISMLMTGLRVAKHEADTDYRQQFQVERATNDLAIGYAMEKLQPGEQLVWTSPYPQEEAARFGKKFITDRGFNAERKLGFIYRAFANTDGSVTLESQTVDNSDEDAFKAVEEAAQYDTDADMETLLRTYDGILVQKHGGWFRAGRRNARPHENAWNELLKYPGLIKHFVRRIEEIAASDQPRAVLRRDIQHLKIGVWKTFKELIYGDLRQPNPSQAQMAAVALGGSNYQQYELYNNLVSNSYQQAKEEGDIMIYCGGAARAEDNEGQGNIDMKSTFDNIFGEKTQTSKQESYSFDKRMYCVVCQAPPKKEETKKMCGPCGICKQCDTKIRTKAKGSFALAA